MLWCNKDPLAYMIRDDEEVHAHAAGLMTNYHGSLQDELIARVPIKGNNHNNMNTYFTDLVMVW